jgi:hypothetical protein
MGRRRLLGPWAGILLVAGLSLFSGCGRSGPRQWPTTGCILLQGKPVAGAIQFRNTAAGVDLVIPLDAEGKYAVATASGPGLPEGEYSVAIMPRQHLPVGAVSVAPIKSPIPQKYRQLATSQLVMTVKPGPNVFNIDLPSQ